MNKLNNKSALGAVIPLQSKPKPRARITRKNKYYNKAYKRYEDALVAILREKQLDFDFSKPFRLIIGIEPDSFFIGLSEDKPLRKRPRGDIDNHAKSILDALAKAYNFDDRNCQSLSIDFLNGHKGGQK